MKIKRDFFKKHLEITKNRLGPRYRPELHVGLPISKIFDGLIRSVDFYEEIRRNTGNIVRIVEKLNGNFSQTTIQENYNKVKMLATL